MTVKHLEQEVADKTFNLAEGVRLKHRGLSLKHLGVGLKRSPTPLTPPFSVIQHQSLLLHCLFLLLPLLWYQLVCSGLGGYTYFSFFVLPGLFHWHLRERALDFGTESCSFFSPGSTQGCTVGAFRMCKGPKTCESLRPYKATVTLGPFASDHAPRQQNASKPTPSYPRQVNGWRKGSERG